MVEDFVVAADLFVLVADGVHAVGAAGDDEFGLDGVEGLDVFVGELAVEVLVAGAAGAVSGAALFFSEDGEVDLGVVEEFDEGAGGFLRVRIVAGGAAYPVEDVGGGVFVGGFDVEAVGPGEALLVVDAPGVLGALHAAEGDWSCEGNSPSIMTWLRRMSMMSSICSFWVGQTSMQAPQVVQAQAASGERANFRSGLGLGVPFSNGRGREGEGILLRGEIVELHALVDLERGGREGFAGGGGGADVLTAVALDAGVGVEETGPGEVFEFVGADGLDFWIRLRFRG